MTEVALVSLKPNDVTLTLLSVGVVLLVARSLGKLAERVGQPRVMGEVLGGIVLGPSVLGHYSAALFSPGTRPLLQTLGTFGLVTFMFLMGLDLDLPRLGNGRHRLAAGVAVPGTVVPFGLGVLLALVLHRGHSGTQMVPFALFLGAAMSVTALPVLARILCDRGLNGSALGTLSMACAVIDDVLTWVTLALVVAIVGASSMLELPLVIGAATAVVMLMVKVVRPRLDRFSARPCTPSTLTGVMVGVLVCSWGTAAIGVHEIFGAFLLGAVSPRGELAGQVRDRLEPIALVLLPVFFVTVGLDVKVGGIGASGVWQLVLISAVACAGKVLGAAAGARAQGLRGREALGLGLIMNTRGLTELVVVDIGARLGIIDNQLFTLLVLMAVITTATTVPLLGILNPDPNLGAAGMTGDDEPSQTAPVRLVPGH